MELSPCFVSYPAPRIKVMGAGKDNKIFLNLMKKFEKFIAESALINAEIKNKIG